MIDVVIVIIFCNRIVIKSRRSNHQQQQHLPLTISQVFQPQKSKKLNEREWRRQWYRPRLEYVAATLTTRGRWGPRRPDRTRACGSDDEIRRSERIVEDDDA